MFFALALDGIKLSFSCSSHFSQQKRAPLSSLDSGQESGSGGEEKNII